MCPQHMKGPEVSISGSTFRFCQKCSKPHHVKLFDGDKRSCREGLERHNVRQRMLRAMKSGGSKNSMQNEASVGGVSDEEAAAANQRSPEEPNAPEISVGTCSAAMQLPIEFFPIADHQPGAYRGDIDGMVALGSNLPFAGGPTFIPPEVADRIIDEFIMELGLANANLMESVGDASVLPPVIQLPNKSYH